MLEYTNVCNFAVEVKTFIESNSACDQYTNFRVVGQEKDGSVLFVWDSKPVNSQIARVVTHIAMHDGESQGNVMLFVYDRVVHIVNCTVNPRRSLIAFTTLVTVPTVENGELVAGRDEDIYKAYTAEILPQNRIYKMYIEGSTHIQLQFLYPRHPTMYTVSDREPRMLMMQHRQSIGLYTFPMARIGDKGVILCNQPKTESLLTRYLWSQWDPVNQRLHVLHAKKMSYRQDLNRPENRRDSLRSGDVLKRTVLTCLQFDLPTEPYEVMLEMPLPISIPRWRSARPTYHAHAPTLYTPERQVNIRVVTTGNGTVCVCYQQPVKEERSLVRRRSSASNGENCATLEYSVCMIHHGKTLHCSVPNVPTHVAENGNISFSWASGYLIALLPGQFIHLLNVGIEFEPCHHIIIHHPDPGPFTASCEAEDVDLSRPLIPVVSDKLPSGALLDVSTMSITKLAIDKEAVLDSFYESGSQAMRLAMLHYAILHARDIGMVKKMFQYIIADPVNPELTALFQEFLIASTYGSYKRSMAKSILEVFPFTTVETFRGQFERSDDRQRTAQLTYSALPRAAMTMAAGDRLTETRGTRAEEMWRNLGAHLNARKFNMSRLNPWNLEKEKLKLEAEKKSTTTAPRKSMSMNSVFYTDAGPPSIFQKISDKAKRLSSREKGARRESATRPPSRTELTLGPVPFFLGDREGAEDVQDENTQLLVGALCQHLDKHKISDDRSKLTSLAMEYVTCMMQQSRQLCHVVWSVFNMDDAETTISLEHPATDQELILFQVYERVYLATIELAYPLPAKFLHYFTVLAFRVLDIRTFLQYVNSHVLALTPDFMIVIIQGLNDKLDENVRIKTQLIAKLDVKNALECYKIWDHPTARKYVSNHMVEQRLVEPPLPLQVRPTADINRSLETSANFESSCERARHSIATAGGDTFPPLDTLMRLLREAENQTKRRLTRTVSRTDRANQLTEHDYSYIQHSALVYSYQEARMDVHANF